MFPRAKISHVVVEGLDYSMLILAFDGITPKVPQLFIYDSRWGKKPECRGIIMEA